MTLKGITLGLINTDAKNLYHDKSKVPQDPNICTLTGKPIVKPPETLEEIRRRTEEAALLSPNAQIRKLLREIDPTLN